MLPDATTKTQLILPLIDPRKGPHSKSAYYEQDLENRFKDCLTKL